MPAIANKLSEAEVTAEPASNAASVKPVVSAAFTPPAESTMPDGDYGKVIRLGQKVFKETSTYASHYVGNHLSCANYHLEAGRKANSAPLWASFIHYPAFRNKTGQADTLASRIQGCFEYSMDGKAPPAGSEIMTALQSYAFWSVRSGWPKARRSARPCPPAATQSSRSPRKRLTTCAAKGFMHKIAL